MDEDAVEDTAEANGSPVSSDVIALGIELAAPRLHARRGGDISGYQVASSEYSFILQAVTA